MINNFYNITVKIMEEVVISGRLKLQNEIHSLENSFHMGVNSKNWHVKDRKTRKLWTPLGDIDITRRIYKNVHTGKCKILFDESLGLIPMVYIQPDFFWKFINSINKVNSYEGLSDIFGQNFSSSTISNILKRGSMSLITKNLRENTPLLFVNIDDIFVLKNKGKKTKVRSAIAYTGINKSKKKNEPVEKALIPINPNISIEKASEELENTLREIYGKIGKVVIVGDAANWITSFKKHMTSFETKRYIDQFHYKKYVKDMMGRGASVDWNYFITLTRDKAMTYLRKLACDDNGEVQFKQPKLFGRVKKWFKSFIECSINKYPNVIEGIQSTQIAKTLKNRRSFSMENIYKILIINAAQYNKWEISHEKTEESVFNFNQKEAIAKSITESSATNVPILEGKATNLSKSINAIVNWTNKY